MSVNIPVQIQMQVRPFIIRLIIELLNYFQAQLKKLKKKHGGMLLLVKLQVSTSNLTKSNTPPWMFFRFFKLYSWCQIAQCLKLFSKVSAFSFCQSLIMESKIVPRHRRKLTKDLNCRNCWG